MERAETGAPRGSGAVLPSAQGARKKVRVGMEASGHARWFERLLTELQFELWIGVDRQGSHGAETRGSTLLDVAEAMGLPADEEVRFARGRARKSPGCVVDHRRNDWASKLSWARRLKARAATVLSRDKTCRTLALLE